MILRFAVVVSVVHVGPVLVVTVADGRGWINQGRVVGTLLARGTDGNGATSGSMNADGDLIGLHVDVDVSGSCDCGRVSSGSRVNFRGRGHCTSIDAQEFSRLRVGLILGRSGHDSEGDGELYLQLPRVL